MSDITVITVDTDPTLHVDVYGTGPQGPPGPVGARVVTILLQDPTVSTPLTAGDSKAYFRVPALMHGLELVDVAAAVVEPSSSGLVTINIRRVRAGAAVQVLTTPLTIDAGETDSVTAATPRVVATTLVSTGDQLHIDVTTAGTNVTGLEVQMVLDTPA